MRITIVEDLMKDRENLLNRITEEFSNAGVPIERLHFFISGEQLCRSYCPGTYDLIFLNIEMTGIETARKIRAIDPDVKLVFCTTSNEFARECYELNIDYYLHKPFTTKDIQRMCRRIYLSNVEAARYIMLPDGQKLLLHNFIFSEYYNHVITISTKLGENIKTRMSQTDLVAFLCTYPQFVPCSKGMIVNLNEIEKMEGNTIKMSNQILVQISRRKVKEVHEAYADFSFTQLQGKMSEC